MEASLKREIARARRKKLSVGLLLIDVDHFKKFNDTYGHDAGDEVLRRLGGFLINWTREEDIACRYGGEEIRSGIESLLINYAGNQLKVTASLGVACYPEHGDHVQAVIVAADGALYLVKEMGRNRLVAVK